MTINNKLEKDPTVTMKLSEYNKIKETITDDAVKTVLKLVLGLPVIVLMDKWGFRKVRLERFIDEVMKQYQFYENGTITMEDIDKVLKEEVGITLT